MLNFALRHQFFYLGVFLLLATFVAATAPHFTGGVDLKFLTLIWVFIASPIALLMLLLIGRDYRQFVMFKKLSENYQFNFLVRPKKGLPSAYYPEWKRKGEYLFALQFGRSTFVLHYKEELRIPFFGSALLRSWDNKGTLFYQDVIVTTDTLPALANYLQARGFQKQTIDERDYWYVPHSSFGLGRFLSRQEIVEMFHLISQEV